MRNLFAAFVLAAGLALAPAIFVAAPAMAQDGDQVVAMQAEVEALILQYAEDEASLELAIEEYVLASGNPELATQAVINALTNPLNADVANLLNENPNLQIAAGQGLGAAIAMIALTDPTAAASMLALVEASGDETLVASVAQGNEDRTASIVEGETNAGDAIEEEVAEGTTPESPASAN